MEFLAETNFDPRWRVAAETEIAVGKKTGICQGWLRAKVIAISRIQETTSPLLVSSSEKYEIADDIEETEGRNGVAQVCELYLFHNHSSRRCLVFKTRDTFKTWTSNTRTRREQRKREKVIVIVTLFCATPAATTSYLNYFRESFASTKVVIHLHHRWCKRYFELIVEKRIIDARVRDIGEANLRNLA